MTLEIEGNIIPPIWYKQIKNQNDRPNYIAIAILADIVNQYDGELIQRSYQSYAHEYGFTKRQVKEAFDDLARLHVIYRQYSSDNKQMYIGINLAELTELTWPDEYKTILADKQYPATVIEPKKESGRTKKKTAADERADDLYAQIKDNTMYEIVKKNIQASKDPMLTEICKCVYREIKSLLDDNDDVIMISGSMHEKTAIEDKLLQLDYMEMRRVIDAVRNAKAVSEICGESGHIDNDKKKDRLSRYIRATLYNGARKIEADTKTAEANELAMYRNGNSFINFTERPGMLEEYERLRRERIIRACLDTDEK